MPSKSDVFDITEKILIDVGFAAVWRGPFDPSVEGLTGTLFPLAAYVPITEERIEQGASQGNFYISGKVAVDFWTPKLEPAGPLGKEKGSWKKLDALHDAVLFQFKDFFHQYGSNTTTITPVGYQEFWWFPDEIVYMGAEMTMEYKLGLGWSGEN